MQHRAPDPACQDCFVEINGARLHYLDFGGSGAVTIGLPGLLQTALAFSAIAPLLTPHVRLLALDARGRGGSSWSAPQAYRVPQYVLDLQGFLSALSLHRVALIGTSFGGGVALLQALLQPGRITRLVLNDVGPNPNLEGLRRVAQRTRSAPAEFGTLDAAIAWFLEQRDGLELLDSPTLARWVGYHLVPTATGTLRFNCDPAMLTSVPLVESWTAGTLVWQKIQRLVMPVLVLRGARSDLLSRETAERMVDVLPRARLVEVPGVGHSPTLFEPEAQAALAEFFGVPLPMAQVG